LRVRRTVAAAAVGATVLGAVVAFASPAGADPIADPITGCDAATCTTTFGAAGAAQTFTVPDGVNALDFSVAGGQGGNAYSGNPGGEGGVVSGELPVSPGQVLTVLVGGAGTSGGAAVVGGGGATTVGGYSGTGGGGSFLFDATGALLVAAGGGGGASYNSGTGLETTGGGAGLDGGPGNGTGFYGPETVPTGGTGAAGGSGGVAATYAGADGSGPAADALPGSGGAGAVSADPWGGGGGGGGYYGGGGGGYLQTGAGGSGYASSDVLDLATTSGANAGDGVVSLGWDLKTPAVELSALPTASTFGDSVTLTATVSGSVDTPTGSVEFDVNGVAIDGCATQPVTAGVATCTTTALPGGSPSLQADYLGDTLYAPTDSALTSYTVTPAAQAITFTSPVPADAVVGGTYQPLATGGGSENAVTFTIDPTTTSVCTTDGSTVTYTAAGTCVIDADQAGDSDYAAAPRAQLPITVAPIATAVAVTSAQSPSVFGQPTTVTASVSGAGAGSVQFAVDGTDLGAPVTVADGSAQSPTLTDADGHSLLSGSHTVAATFTPADPTVHGPSSNSTTQIIDQAATTTSLAVHPSTVTATVTAVAPGAGTPSGSVSFLVDGTSIGSATLVGGVATLDTVVASGKTQQVAAQYLGDTDFTGSANSTARSDPSITATLSSAHSKTRFGWYRSPVTVTFRCTTHGAALTSTCPKPVTLSANGAAQSLTRTVAATNGGLAAVTVRGINIDRTSPSVTVSGIRNGAVYNGAAPTAHCVGKDATSGIASCTLTRHTSGARTTYRAVATDKAGNIRAVTGSYTLRSIYLQNATYSNAAFNVKTGHTYTIVVVGSGARPVFYDAAVYPRHPTTKDHAFHAAGHHRWALAVTITKALHTHRYWNLGVKIGNTLHKIKIRVA
jgi:hypothetical protein